MVILVLINSNSNIVILIIDSNSDSNSKANLRTILDFRGFDSSTILISRRVELADGDPSDNVYQSYFSSFLLIIIIFVCSCSFPPDNEHV